MGVGALAGMLVLAAFILTIRDRLVGPRPVSPAEQQAAEAAWHARLLAPDWPAVERQLGRPAPAVLRKLYADHAILLSPPLTVSGPPGAVDAEWEITSFHPADGRGDHFWIPPRAFCFATSVCGDPYYVELGAEGEDGPVSVHYHDGGDIVRVADSLAEFLSWPRQPDGRHRDAEA